MSRPRVCPLKRVGRRLVLEGECWVYSGSKTRDGYGQVFVATTNNAGVKVYVHRLAYERWVGPIPDGMQLDHLCRNRACVNPAHLEPVTPAENTRRGLGPAGVNARKTHCAHGHEFTPENTAEYPNRRICLACNRGRK